MVEHQNEYPNPLINKVQGISLH